MMENELETTGEKKPERDEKGRLLPGNTANPKGRPKGSLSIKDLVRQFLEDNPEDLKKFVEHFVKKNRELAWQMLEGNPKSTVEASLDTPTPLLHAIRHNDGNGENQPAPKAD